MDTITVTDFTLFKRPDGLCVRLLSEPMSTWDSAQGFTFHCVNNSLILTAYWEGGEKRQAVLKLTRADSVKPLAGSPLLRVECQALPPQEPNEGYAFIAVSQRQAILPK